METSRRPFLRRPLVLAALAVTAVLFAIALWLFAPWTLFVDKTVNEALPTVAATAPAAPGSPDGGAPETPTAPAQPVVLAQGELISHEHATSGIVQLIELPNGERIIRLENLSTSNGPQLKVWVTDAPVIEGVDGWWVFDDGRYVDLGDLKGNQGSSNYPVPADADLTGLTSVSIWCDRFNVSFGAAELQPVLA